MSICSGTEPEEVPRIGKELYILPSAYDRLIPHMSVVLGVIQEMQVFPSHGFMEFCGKDSHGRCSNSYWYSFVGGEYCPEHGEMNMTVPRKLICLNLFGLKIKVKNPWYHTEMVRFLNEQIARQNGYDVSAIRQARSVVLFVLPGKECVSGGILSIFSLCRYTREILPDSAVVLVTEAGNKTYAEASWFHADEKIYRWDQVMDNLHDTEHLIIHIPEYMAACFCDKLPETSRRILQSIPDLTINILNQNPKIMPPSDAVQKLFELTLHVTQTLAFRERNIQEIADKYNIPVTTIFSYIDLSRWTVVPFYKKEKIILLSPDKNEYRSSII